MIDNKLKDIIKEEVLIIKNEKNNFFFTSSDGNWLFDFRRAFMQGKFLNDFSCFFWDKYENLYPFQVGGLELGAIPFISGIVMEGIKRGKNINSFFVRKERKSSGLGNKIEGRLSDEKIIIVDDLFNSGSSISKVLDSLKDEGKDIYKIFTFINFGNEKGRYFLEKNNLDYDFEFTLSDFGLDIFGNSLEISKDNFKSPLIFPNYQKIYELKNSNKFLEVPKSNPLKDGKNLYLGGEGGTFISICGDTGKLNWEFKVDTVKGHKNILSSPLLLNDSIIFGSYDGNLYSLDKSTGKNNWNSVYSDWIGSSPIYSNKFNLIYVGLELGGINNKGSLVGIDLNNGEKKWEVFFNDYVHCSPGYSEQLGIVVCGGNDGKLVCVRGDNGNIIFERNFNSPIKGGFNFSDNGKIAYFGCFNGNLYSLDLVTGKINWSFKTNNSIYATPLIIGNDIFFGSLDKYFYHIDINGNLIKSIKTFGKIFSKPTFIKKNVIAFGSNDSYIYFYDFEKKVVLFAIEHKERINTNIIYDKEYEHLYVYDFLNTIYKYNLYGFLD